MEKSNMLIFAFLLFSLVGVIFYASVKMFWLLLQVGEWDIPEYQALITVSLILIITIYGVIHSYLNKVSEIRKLKKSSEAKELPSS